MEGIEEPCAFGQLQGVASLLVLVGLFSYEISLLMSEAHAIPAFARKYGLLCSVCYVPGVTKLNDFGSESSNFKVYSPITRKWPRAEG